MFHVIQYWSKKGKERILCDDKGKPIIFNTEEEAEKAIDMEIDKFVDELCKELGKSSETRDDI